MHYFVIEGIDTSGKTTQHKLLQQRLGGVNLQDYKKHDDIIFINEPGATDLGFYIRQLLLHEHIEISKKASFLLFLAQRAEIFTQIINIPNIVISDRSLLSGIAYDLSLNITQALYFNLFATYNTLPEKIVFLEIPQNEIAKRLSGKQLDSIEQNGIEYLMNIQSRFHEILHYICDIETYKKISTIQEDYSLQKFYHQNTLPKILRLDATYSKEELHEQIFTFFFDN
ncbi:dTMP kinase [Helicobacter didelphidarum]|uniref:Thymidylate kinase n=1 Tax=Helicobacter didelphidarum TaxID=2040648 RepID=A0A3D8IGI5_9HELI|nr:dTMP kinase [Helicobacter didelphidarum]RDU64233.1 dTMP kinase [Helicobacter didelphidarum]